LDPISDKTQALEGGTPVDSAIRRRVEKGITAMERYRPIWHEALAFFDNDQYVEQSAVTGDLARLGDARRRQLEAALADAARAQPDDIADRRRVLVPGRADPGLGVHAGQLGPACDQRGGARREGAAVALRRARSVDRRLRHVDPRRQLRVGLRLAVLELRCRHVHRRRRRPAGRADRRDRRLALAPGRGDLGGRRQLRRLELVLRAQGAGRREGQGPGGATSARASSSRTRNRRSRRRRQGQANKDLVFVHHYLEKPCPAYPQGRWIVYAGGKEIVAAGRLAGDRPGVGRRGPGAAPGQAGSGVRTAIATSASAS
jgi:hypothetical protein